MSELKTYRFLGHDEIWADSPNGSIYYLKSEADKVISDKDAEIAELKNSIAQKQSDKTLQERLNEVCKKHAVSTLQDLDWAFCMTEARLEDYTKLAAQKHEALEKMLQYKVLYKEKCRDINTQERFFAMNVAHQKYKRCLAMANMCSDKASAEYAASYVSCDEYYHNHAEFWVKWHKRWLAIAEKFKTNLTAQ